MAKLSDSERQALERNPNVLKLTGSNVTYTPDFKLKAVKDFLQGLPPVDIFRSAKIDVSSFDSRYPLKTIKRWVKVYKELGEDGFTEEQRGQGARGRPKKNFKSLEEENKYLRMELFILKKLQALAELKKKKGSK